VEKTRTRLWFYNIYIIIYSCHNNNNIWIPVWWRAKPTPVAVASSWWRREYRSDCRLYTHTYLPTPMRHAYIIIHAYDTHNIMYCIGYLGIPCPCVQVPTYACEEIWFKERGLGVCSQEIKDSELNNNNNKQTTTKKPMLYYIIL